MEWLSNRKIWFQERCVHGQNTYCLFDKPEKYFKNALNLANLIKEKLISVKKFDVNMRTAQGYTRLHHAISDGAFKSAKFLVENGADVLALGPGGETAVGMAEAL